MAVISDDLTGSCDTAAQFCSYGLTTAVTSDITLSHDLPVKVLVVNTATRSLPEEKARSIVALTLKRLKSLNRKIFYKKIDSTAKGNWCAEIKEIRDGIHPDLVIVAPAFPTWGRTTKNGTLRIEGHDTQRSMSQYNSKLNNHDLFFSLQFEFGSQVNLVRREIVCRGLFGIEEYIQSTCKKGHRIFLFDVEYDSDLQKIAAAGSCLDKNILWVGSAGLARFLPFGWGFTQAQATRKCLGVKQPALLVCGSLNPINKEQLQLLSSRGMATNITIQSEDFFSSSSKEEKLKLVRTRLSHGKSVALSLQLDKGIRPFEHLQKIHDTLQEIIRSLLDDKIIGPLILVGGDTAFKVCEETEAKAIQILGEVEPGIPFGRWIGGKLEGHFLVSKAGGFGHKETLCKIFEFLKKN